MVRPIREHHRAWHAPPPRTVTPSVQPQLGNRPGVVGPVLEHHTERRPHRLPVPPPPQFSRNSATARAWSDRYVSTTERGTHRLPVPSPPQFSLSSATARAWSDRCLSTTPSVA